MSAIVTSLLYITIGLALAGVVGRALSRSGRAFLRTRFNGQDGAADAVDRLLVVAFYLLAAGFIALTVPTGAHIGDGGQALRLLSVKLGELLLVLGALHLASTITFARLRGSRASAMLPADEDLEFPGGTGAGADGLGRTHFGNSYSASSDSASSGSGFGGSGSGLSGSGEPASGDSASDRFGPAGRRAPRPLTSASAAARAATAPAAAAAAAPAASPHTHGAHTQTARSATAGTASARAAARAAAARAAASGLRPTPPPPGLWRPRRAAH